MKHIAIRYHYIRELYEMKILDISFRGTEDMPADMFMKPLPRPKVEHLSKLAGLATRVDHSDREDNSMRRVSILVLIGSLFYLRSKLPAA
jgi:hypothetical protein